MDDDVVVRRLGPGDEVLAGATAVLMASVFEEDEPPADDGRLGRLLADPTVWLYAAVEREAPIGGLTAHVLPLTRAVLPEVFVYDIAVREDRQRRGVGAALMAAVRADAERLGVLSTWTIADTEDGHALAFYRRDGGEPTDTVMFTWPAEGS